MKILVYRSKTVPAFTPLACVAINSRVSADKHFVVLSIAMVAELLNYPIGAIYFGLVIASCDYHITTIFVELVAMAKKCEYNQESLFYFPPQHFWFSAKKWARENCQYILKNL